MLYQNNCIHIRVLGVCMYQSRINILKYIQLHISIVSIRLIYRLSNYWFLSQLSSNLNIFFYYIKNYITWTAKR